MILQYLTKIHKFVKVTLAECIYDPILEKKVYNTVNDLKKN